MKQPVFLALTTALLLLAGASSTLAETEMDRPPKEVPPLPEGELLKPIADKAAWTIHFEFLPSAKQETPEQMTALNKKRPKTAKLARINPYFTASLVLNEPGNELEYYSNGALFYLKQSSQEVKRTLPPVVEPGEEPPIIISLLQSIEKGVFPGLQWIDKKHYIGVQSVGGIPCLVFEHEGVKAWIDLKNRTPTLWKSGVEVRRFVDEGVPSTIGIPQNILAAMAAREKQRKSLTAPPPRGG